MEAFLRGISGSRTVLMGVGNVLRGDDAFGPELAGMLAGKTELVCIDAGTTPENQIGAAARHHPQTILIADAVHLGLDAGACAILEGNEIARFTGLGTHDASPALFLERLQDATGASVRMLAVQPLSLDFGGLLSDPVRLTMRGLASLLEDCFRPGSTSPSRGGDGCRGPGSPLPSAPIP
jgi:hydrogenase 3 maturation protease